MADKNAKAVKNVAGKYYVDSNCINCGQCIDIAADYFVEDADGSIYVQVQPTTEEGVALCEQAVSSCPVNAIGNDGE